MEKGRENLQKYIVSKAQSLPEVPQDIKEAFLNNIPGIKKTAEQLQRHIAIFKRHNEAIYKNIESRHPALIDGIQAVLALTTSSLETLSAGQLLLLIDRYNTTAHTINTILTKISFEAQQTQEREYMSEVAGQRLKEEQLSLQDKLQLRKLALDLWEEIFPKTYTDKFVLYMLGKKGGKVTGASKIAAAPMNGIESALRGVIGIFNPHTYVQIARSIETISHMSMEDWGNMYVGAKKIYEQLSTGDKIAPAISLITSMVFLVGGATKLSQIVRKLGYSTRLIRLALALRTIEKSSSLAKNLPTATITGLVLPYIH